MVNIMYNTTVKTSIKMARDLAEKTLSDLIISDFSTQKFTLKTIDELCTCNDVTEVKNALYILETSMSATGTTLSDFDAWDFKELLEKIVEETSTSDDFWLELPCGEVRVIDKEAINEIWHESLIEQIKDCYDLSNVPSFVEIDWDATAENCKVDGMGHHFAVYDGEEHTTETHYIFRTN